MAYFPTVQLDQKKISTSNLIPNLGEETEGRIKPFKEKLPDLKLKQYSRKLMTASNFVYIVKSSIANIAKLYIVQICYTEEDISGYLRGGGIKRSDSKTAPLRKP